MCLLTCSSMYCGSFNKVNLCSIKSCKSMLTQETKAVNHELVSCVNPARGKVFTKRDDGILVTMQALPFLHMSMWHQCIYKKEWSLYSLPCFHLLAFWISLLADDLWNVLTTWPLHPFDQAPIIRSPLNSFFVFGGLGQTFEYIQIWNSCFCL